MDPIAQLEELAAAAQSLAQREQGLAIGTDDAPLADRALEAQRGHADRVDPLGNVFGAWLGRLAVKRWNGRWVGLAEPVAPRIEVRGILWSPIDVVRRRLQDPAAPTLQKVVETVDRWVRDHDAGLAEAAERNRAAWDALAGDLRFAGPIRLPADPAAALDPWVRAEGVQGKELLCLGAGGGRQGPLHHRAGARVTVVDLSEKQLEHDRKAGLKTVCASIDDLSPLAAASFDIVVQPVSACYVADLGRVYGEVARVLRPGGLYVVQHKAPGALQAGAAFVMGAPSAEGWPLPPQPEGSEIREPGTLEFIHPLEALLGGLCRAGFAIEDVVEPPRGDAFAPPGSPAYRAWLLPPYLRLKARRR